MRVLGYLSREVFHCMLILMIILLLIMVSNTFVHYLSQAATGSMSSSAVLNLISFTLPNFIVILIPIAFFLALVVSFGKLFADNELLVLLACGLSWKALIRMGFKMALVLSIAVGFLSFWLVPKMLQHRDQLQIAAQNNSAMTDVQTGQFLVLKSGQQVIYVGSMLKPNTSNTASVGAQFQNLFMYEQLPAGGEKITFAPYATQTYDPELQQEALILDSGEQYKLVPGQKDVQQVEFEHYKIPVTYGLISEQSRRVSALSSWDLIQADSISSWNELVWRLSQCLTVFVLLLLGLSICWVPPRRSRYLKIIPAILIFMIYFNLLAMAHNWANTGWVPVIINVWGVHLLFLLTSGIILWRRERYL